MDFYLQEKTGSKTRFSFPIVPNDVNVTAGANTIPLNIIKTGEGRIPRGEKATGYSLEGTFPGQSWSGQSFVTNWQPPKNIVDLLEKWKKNGTTLLFMVGDFINDDVFIETFNRRYFGMGHVKYNMVLTHRQTLTITTSPAPAPKRASGSAGSTYPTGKVTGKKVKYRSSPGSSYKKLGYLKKGDAVTIYATSGNWYKIKESPEWWINATYVKITSGQPEAATKSSSSSKKKQAKNPTTNTGNNTSKQPLTVKVPTAKRVQVAKTATRVTYTGTQAAQIKRYQATK